MRSVPWVAMTEMKIFLESLDDGDVVCLSPRVEGDWYLRVETKETAWDANGDTIQQCIEEIQTVMRS